METKLRLLFSVVGRLGLVRGRLAYDASALHPAVLSRLLACGSWLGALLGALTSFATYAVCTNWEIWTWQCIYTAFR